MPTILERIRPTSRPTRDAQHVIKDVGDTIASGATAAGDAVSAAVTDASAAVAGTVSAVADRVADVTGSLTDRLASAASDTGKARKDAADAASKAIDGRVADLRDALTKTTHDIDRTFQDARARIADGAPVDEVVRRIERDWPGTDRDRYERAFQRGYARGRSGRLAVGLVLGASAAAAVVYLMDPERGERRRDEVVRRSRKAIEDGRRMLVERGYLQSGSAGTPPGATGVAVSPAGGAADAIEEDIPVSVAAGAPATMPADTDRGAWHRDIEG
jgi:gas vesicle protein